jgi:hypothetical protein
MSISNRLDKIAEALKQHNIADVKALEPEQRKKRIIELLSKSDILEEIIKNDMKKRPDWYIKTLEEVTGKSNTVTIKLASPLKEWAK